MKGAVGILVLFLLLLPEMALAQDRTGTVTGRVLSAETGDGLGTATVQVNAAADSSSVTTSSTGFDGRFRVQGLAEGAYFIEISVIGYGSRTTDVFELEPDMIYEFGEILLSQEALELDPITVVSERPAIEYEADRTSYAVDAMAGAEGGTIRDALLGVPDLDMDLDGNVELRGDEPAIWVDGRPAPVSGQSLTEFLENFPSDLIDRIEVLDNPGSEFDAEGTGGIVNIVLKEGVDLGLSGSVFANADTRGSTGVGGRGTMQRGDWVFNANASVRRSDSETESYRLRQNLAVEPNDFLERDSWNAGNSLGGGLGVRATWTPRDEARMWVRADYSGSGSERDGQVTTTHMDEAQDPWLRYDRFDLQDSDSRSMDFRTGFEWRWEPRRHTLDLELRMSDGTDRREAWEEIVAEEGYADEIMPAEYTLEDRFDDDRSFRADLRYRRPLGEGSLRTGWSFRHDINDNERSFTEFDDPEGDGIRNLRGFEREQRFNSAYLTLDRPITEMLSIQGGLRAEHVSWDLAFPETEGIDGTYFDIFPSLNLNWRIDDSRRIRLSYSQRIGRPGVNVLNPTDQSTEPLERRVGNPEIDPRYTHRVNLNANWSGRLGNLSVGPYVSRTNDGWERITTVDAEGVSTTTWDNLSSQTQTGASVNLSLPRRGTWRGSVNLSGSRTEWDAGELDGRFARSSSGWRARANLSGNLFDGFSAQTRMSYRAAGRSVQGRDGSQASVDLSFRYRFLNNRASANLSLRDPFALQRSESEIRNLTIWEIRETSRATRSAQFSISYSLGGGGGMMRGGPGGR